VNKFDRLYTILALVVAQASKDPSTKVGAVVVDEDNRIASTGYNGFPPGIEDSDERLADREQKYPRTRHAEANALDRVDVQRAKGGTLYVTAPPCSKHGCASYIVSKRLARVVAVAPSDEFADRWADVVVSRDMFCEAGIQYEEVTIPRSVEAMIVRVGNWVRGG